jgi:hypothetical protein
MRIEEQGAYAGLVNGSPEADPSQSKVADGWLDAGGCNGPRRGWRLGWLAGLVLPGPPRRALAGAAALVRSAHLPNP